MDIAVHPEEGRIYWILSNHNIMSTNMDGSDAIEVCTTLR